MSESNIGSVETYHVISNSSHSSLGRYVKIIVVVTELSAFLKQNLHLFNSKRILFEMQNVINTVKGTALGVAEFLTPVLKVNLCGS